MSCRFVSALLVAAFLAGIAMPMVAPAGIHQAAPAKNASAGVQGGALARGLGVFTANAGQVADPDILFFTPSGAAAFSAGAVMLYAKGRGTERQGALSAGPGAGLEVPDSDRGLALRLTFPGADPVAPEGLDPAGWKSNFLLGDDPGQWRTGVQNYRALIYEGLWDGIDLVYRMEGGALKYEFLVAPGADPAAIRVQVEGQQGMSVRGGRALDIDIGGGRSISDAGLDVFYSDNGADKLEASFELRGEGTYGFSVDGWDGARALTIDPLMYSTYLGGSGYDRATDVAVDDKGCAYLVGYTDSLNFPTTPGVIDTTWAGFAYDAFITKMGMNGATVAYSTYIGGDAGDFINAVTVDDKGYAYFAGYTMSYYYPTTPGAVQEDHTGDTYDAFVSKLSPGGDYLVYSTFLGGDGWDFANGIAVDVNGFAYVIGDTRSFDFPITSNAILDWYHGMRYSDERDNILYPDVFVSKISQLGTSLSYSTYIGGNNSDIGTGIAVDGNGYAYITGLTWSDNFLLSADPYSHTNSGMCDAFAAKLTQTGSRIMYSTYIGGPGLDMATAIEIGAYGTVLITGQTTSSAFPTTEGSWDTTHNGLMDSFALSLGKDGDCLCYSTLFGSTGNDYCTDMAIDPLGCVYMTGYTDSPDLVTTENAYDRTGNGLYDGFIAKFSPSGALLHSTYLGGTGSDSCLGIALGDDGYAYVAGETSSADYPVTAGALDLSNNGGMDAFVTKLDIAPPVTDAGPPQVVPEGTVVRFDGTNSTDNHGIVNYTWEVFDGVVNVTMYGTGPSHLFDEPGLYKAWLNTTDISGNWDLDCMNLTILDITHPVAVAGPDITADEDTLVRFDGTGSTDNVGVVNYTWSFTEGGWAKRLWGPTPAYVFRMPGIYNVTLLASDAAGNNATDSLLADIRDVTRPVAEAGKDRRIYQHTTLEFNGTASRDNVQVVNYTWRLSDGASQLALYGPRPAHLFSVVGIFPVTLNVTDAAGLWDTDTMTLTVLEIVKPVAEAGPDLAADEGSPVRFDGSACTDNVGVACWLWSFSDGVNDVTVSGERCSWVFRVPGAYEVTLNASDAAGNWATDTLTVTVRDALPPAADAGANIVVAAGQDVALDGTASFDSSGIAAYAWTFTHNGTAVTLEGPVQSYRFWTPGVYNVTLTVTDSTGAQGSTAITITVLDQAGAGAGAWTDSDGWPLVFVACGLFVAAAAVFGIQRRRSDRS